MSKSALRLINDPASHELSGPDFLLAVADAEEHLGNVINADEYRRRARQWQRDLDALGGMPDIEQEAANAPTWPSHLPRLVRASELVAKELPPPRRELPAHHITPSDHR
jgi:hypothetical protein